VVPNPGRTISVLALGQCHLDLPKIIDEKMTKLKRDLFTVCFSMCYWLLKLAFPYFYLVCPFLSRIINLCLKKLLLR